LDYFVTLSNVVYLLGFHFVDELGIKEVNMNPAMIFFLEINLCGVISNPHSVTTLWYECGNTGKILQRCVTNLL